MRIDLRTIENSEYKVNVSHFRHENPKGIVFVIPGAGYSHMGPCLYYPSIMLYELGLDVLNFEYDFRRERLKDESQEAYSDYYNFLFDGIKDIKLSGIKIVLSKSIGTRIIGSGDTSQFDKIIWLTPAIRDQFVVDSIINNSKKSHMVIGDADPSFNKETIDLIKIQGGSCKIISGADHGLDIDRDLYKSLDSMKEILKSVKDFIEKT